MSQLFTHWMNGPGDRSVLSDSTDGSAPAADRNGGVPRLESVGDRAIRIHSPGPVDFFIDPKDRRTVANAPFRYLETAGDFSLTAEVTPEFGATYDAGTLFVWFDETHWAKLAYEFTDMGFPAVVSVVTNGTSDDANGQRLLDGTVRFRISRRGNLLALHWQPVLRGGAAGGAPSPVGGGAVGGAAAGGAPSPVGGAEEAWFMKRYLSLGETGGVARVGLMVQSPTGTGTSALFENVSMGDAPGDMRAGL